MLTIFFFLRNANNYLGQKKKNSSQISMNILRNIVKTNHELRKSMISLKIDGITITNFPYRIIDSKIILA